MTKKSICKFIFITAVLITTLAQANTESLQPDSIKTFEAFQSDLIDIAFETATAIPANPHIVKRSRAQEDVTALLLELGQPEVASQYIEKIENWRKGSAYADVGLYYALHGNPEKAQEYFDRAEKVAATINDWQKDRIRAHIARGYALVGKEDIALEMAKNIDLNEGAKISPISAMTAGNKEYKKELAAIKKMLESKLFDVKQQGLLATVELWNTFYANKGRRKSLEKLLNRSWNDLGGVFRIEVLFMMADYAIKHQDQPKARELLSDASMVYDQTTWLPEKGIPYKARLAGLLFRAGDVDIARQMASDAENIYNEKRDDIVNIDRAQTLAPLAQAYQSMGLNDAAFNIYAKALEESVVNPNSRPRAEDLSLICRSMAQASFEPTEGIWKRIREIKDGLGNPW